MKKWSIIEKVGSIGSFVAALACPACFPLLAVVGTALGFRILLPFEGSTVVIFQILVAVALLGNIASYLSHKKKIVLIVGVISPVMIFISFYFYWNSIILYIGLFGLLIASILNSIAKRKCKTCSVDKKKIKLQSIITCPRCGSKKEETMPTTSCQYMYKCSNCGTMLTAKSGDCCIFCSYGSEKCSAMQEK